MVLPVLSLLAEAGFDGLVVSEADPEYQNAQELRMDVLLFEAWRERHGPRPGVSAPAAAGQAAGREGGAP